MTRTVLVTGAASFIGANILPMLASQGWKIITTLRNSSQHFKTLELNKLGIEVVRMDLSDQGAYEKLPDNLDAIIHLAALSPEQGGTREGMMKSNVMGTFLLTSYAKRAGVKTFIFASSMSVYGDIKVPFVDENTDIINLDAYGLTKYFGENLLKEIIHEGYFRSLSIRLPCVLGHSAPRHWLSLALNKIKSGDDITIFNPDAKYNTAIDVEDLGIMIQNALNGSWQGAYAFPIGSAAGKSIYRVIEHLILEMSSKSKIIIKEENKLSYQVSNDFASKNFDYHPRTILDTLSRFAEKNKG